MIKNRDKETERWSRKSKNEARKRDVKNNILIKNKLQKVPEGFDLVSMLYSGIHTNILSHVG